MTVSSQGASLSGVLFGRVFPFHIAWDDNLILSSAGASLQKICPDVIGGAAFQALFEMILPAGEMCSAFFENHSNTVFVFRHRATGIKFRGQVLVLTGTGLTVLLASPWLTHPDQAERMGLVTADFAIHDQTLDLLRVLHTQQLANEDLKKVTDVLTEQRAKLREREAEARKLAMVAARTDNAVVMTDAKGAIEWVNDGFVRMTGWSLDEVKGQKPGSFLQGPETDAATVDRIRDKVRSGQPFTAELLNYRKDGQRYWVYIEVQPILGADGQITNFMAMESDITQRRRHEQRQAVQLEVSKILAEADTVHSAIPRVLQTVCEQLGWLAGAMWRRAAAEGRLEPIEYWHADGEHVKEFFTSGSGDMYPNGQGILGRTWETRSSQWIADLAVDRECPRSFQAGAFGIHGALAFPVFNQGSIIGVMEILSARREEPDMELLEIISSIGNQIGQFLVKKSAEEALKAASALHRAILDGTGYSIISTDSSGLIKVFNLAAERMLGYSAEEIVHKQTPEILHDPVEVVMRAAELTMELDRPVQPGFEVFVAQARNGISEEREWTYVRKDGSTLPVLLSVAALLDDAGAPVGYVGIGTDITERRRSEEAFHAAKEQAEAASRAKSDFLATMSHEIRTPMNGIIGMAALLLESKLDSSQREMVEAVHTSGEALMTIIEDILDFSKIEARRLDLLEEAYSVDSVIDGVVDLLNHKMQSKGLEMSVVVDADVPMTMVGDPGRLRQVLLNLVGNAIKFTDEGEVNLFARLVRGREPESTSVEFTIADTGIGMSPSQIDRLFSPFSQVDGSTTRRFGGTGLGLVISKRLIEMMGGSIAVESRPYEGSRFIFSLPLRTGLTLDAGVAWPEEARNFRVLVADTQPLSLDAARGALEGMTHEPAHATDEAALTKLLDDPNRSWDVAVIDRRILGEQTKGALSRLADQKRKPRIVLLGQLTDSLIENEPADVLLTRPLRRLHLRSALSKLGRPVTQEPAGFVTPRKNEMSMPSQDLPRLLIVEDNEVNARLATLLLEKLGYAPELARDGAEGVERFEKGEFDAILMDCHMPVMDGYAATRRIREIEATGEWHRPSCQIIAMTANAMTGERERCLEAGMDDYLSKPLRAAALMEALNQIQILDPAPKPALPEVWTLSEQADCSQAVLQLVEEISPEAVIQLVDKWLYDTPARLEEMMCLAGGSEQSTLRRAAHSVKGSSALFGLTRMVQLCGEMEQMAERNIVTGQTPLATSLLTAFDTAESMLRTEVERLVPVASA